MPKIINHLKFTKNLPDKTEDSFNEEKLDESRLCTVTYVYKGDIYAIHVIKIGESSKIDGGSVAANTVTLDWHEPEDKKKQEFFVDAYNELPYINTEGKPEKKPGKETEWYTRQHIGNGEEVGTGEIEKGYKNFSKTHKIKKSIVVYAKECANDADYNLINHYGLDGVVGPIIGPYCPLRTELFGNDEARILKLNDSASTKISGEGKRANFTSTRKEKLINEKKQREEAKVLARKDCYYYRLRKSDGDAWIKLGELEKKIKELYTKKPDTEIYCITGAGGTYTVTEWKITKEAGELKISEIKGVDETIIAYKSDYWHARLFYKDYVINLRKDVNGFKENLLITGDRSKFGAVAPKNEIQIDHIHPAEWYGGEEDPENGLQDPGGSNSFCNSVMISAELNNFKSNASAYKLETKKL